MSELAIEEAAAAYGVAPETIWGAIQNGQLYARIDPYGRYLVTVPPPLPEPTQALAVQAPPAANGAPQYDYGQHYAQVTYAAPSTAEVEIIRLTQELEYTRYLLAEVSHQRDQLEAQVQAELRQIERSEEAQHELRVLIGSAMRPGNNALRELPPTPAPSAEAPDHRHRHWWPFGH